MSMSRIDKKLSLTVPLDQAKQAEKKRFEVTEEWVERLIAEAQEEERRNPISDEELVVGFIDLSSIM
jgi:hypothetical protein